ncbi:MAG: ABC transporter permease [Oscillospiraceae bacterium]|jgi:ABC-2 type transport system permease protein
MQVFKLYFKIIKRNIPMLLIYICVFVGVSLIYIAAGQTDKVSEFTESRAPVAFIIRDSDSELIEGLREYVGKKNDIVELPDDDEKLRDALFFSKAEYIVIVPEGFTESFMSGGDAVLYKKSVPGSTAGIYLDMLIDDFLNTASAYLKYLDAEDQSELVLKTSQDLAVKTDVIYAQYGAATTKGTSLSAMFNFTAYPMTIILILGVASFMSVFNEDLKKKRTLCAPVRHSRLSLETLLSNSVFTAVVWAVFLAAAFILAGSELWSAAGLMWSVNLLLAAITGLSISFLVGSVIKNKNAQNAAANTISLGLAFLSGCFVPQSLLSDSVLNVARFFPAYWFVKANDEIGRIKLFNMENLSGVLTCFLIQLGFAAAIICITVVVTRQRGAETERLVSNM